MYSNERVFKNKNKS